MKPTVQMSGTPCWCPDASTQKTKTPDDHTPECKKLRIEWSKKMSGTT
jgi:hypothetical protein